MITSVSFRGWNHPAPFYIRAIAMALLFFSVTLSHAQLITISAARQQPAGSTVTVNGVVTSGSEFGTIRYIQDGTAGIALFSTSLATVVRGDNVTVTGVTVQFQNLLELQPVTSFTVNSQGNALPTPQVVTPSGLDEPVESQLVRVNDAVFLSSGTFQGNSSYLFVANNDTGVVYVRGTNPLVGQNIPSSSIDIIGVCTQFAAVYQLMPRDMSDLIPASSISIVQPPFPTNISTTGMDVSWNTDVQGTSYLQYGHTPALELGVINASGNGPSFTANISGGNPSELYYGRAVAVLGQDTSYSAVRVFITASGSTGTVKAYFNRPADHYVATPSSNLAEYLPGAFDDTIAAYIDRCQLTLDLAIYNFDINSTGLIVQAVNDAKNRGVQVRVIAEGGNSNTALSALDPAIPVLLSPTTPPSYYGIMHNKFLVLDAGSPDANAPVVMSGSTNFTSDQLNQDRNNLVFVQDKSLAKVYTMEFEEMWGSSSPTPNSTNSKFGPDKSDNTPHELSVGGKRMECYFSPSDNTNFQIGNTISTADNELYFATLVFTRFDLAYQVEERVSQFGVYAAGIMDDSTNGSGTSFLIMQAVMNSNLLLFDHASQTGILHHKYLIVDQSVSSADPLVLTGSHNWSSSANLRNDENTLVIHDPLVANQFYQEFHNLFNSNGGAVGLSQPYNDYSISLYPNPTSGTAFVYLGEENSGTVTLQLSTISGKSLWKVTQSAGKDNRTIRIPDMNLSAGVYLLNIITDSAVESRKLVVH
jgi:hypothetical protein